MSDKILWVINPNAGNGEHDALIDHLENTSEGKIYLTDGKNDRTKLLEQIDQLNPELIVAGGGDGTIKLCATCIKGKNNMLGILPLGSANGLAEELGLRELPENIAKKYHESAYECVELDSILINGEHHCFHLSDMGLNARIVKGFEDQPVRGFTGYALGALDQLGNDEWYFTVSYNGKVYDTLMVILANAKKYGTGVTINPKGKINDGKFEIGILKEINPRLVGQILFNPEELPNKEWFQIESVSQVELRTERPIDLQIDGEYIGIFKSVNAQILPNFITIAIPKF